MRRAPTQEQIESDLSVGDQEDDRYREMSVDRIRALAYSSDLGSAIKRLQVKHSAAHLLRAIETLKSALKREIHFARSMDPEDLDKVAKVAALKLLQPACSRCEGRGWVNTYIKDAPRVDCLKCEGKGRRLYNPGEIFRAFGRKMTRDEWMLLEAADVMIETHERLAGNVVARVVGR